MTEAPGKVKRMARGEALVTCPHCGSKSRIPVVALRHDNYHCSTCGSRVPLTNVNVPEDDQNKKSFRRKPKKGYQQRKRR